MYDEILKVWSNLKKNFLENTNNVKKLENAKKIENFRQC